MPQLTARDPEWAGRPEHRSAVFTCPDTVAAHPLLIRFRTYTPVTGASVSVRSGVPSPLIHSPLTRTRAALPRTFAAHFIGFAARVTLGIFLETTPSQMPRLPAARSERLSLTCEEWMPWFGTA